MSSVTRRLTASIACIVILILAACHITSFASTITEARSLPDGSNISLDPLIVSAAYPDGLFFAETSDRSSAIAIKVNGLQTPQTGSRVTVTGTIRTSQDKERYVDADLITADGGGTIYPLGMNLRDLIGGPQGLQMGAEGLGGPSNMGMLVRTWGTLNYDTLLPSVNYGTSNALIEIPTRTGLALDPDWRMVLITGNVRSRQALNGGPLSPLVRASDVRSIRTSEENWSQQYYPDFTGDPGSIILTGSARFTTDPLMDSTRRLRLTSNAPGQVGSAWYNQKVAVSAGLSTKFAFQLSFPNPEGADGVAFVLHNNAAGVGAIAGETGPPNSICVTFDSHHSDSSEPSGNAVEIRVNQQVMNGVDLTQIGINLEDERAHFTHINIVPDASVAGLFFISVKLDGVTVLNNVAVETGGLGIIDPEGKAWIGFGARCGATGENHDIIHWRFMTPCSSPSGFETATRHIVVGEQSEPERLAAVDLQRYLGQVTGEVPDILDTNTWLENPQPAVVIGTPQTNALLAGRGIESSGVGNQGFYLANSRISGCNVILAAGLTSEGATNAIYGLLRELGFGFYMGSEAVPASIPCVLPKSPVVREPAFKVRGVLPWYNFFNSPTVWDPADHRSFADQLIRSGANFVGFHTYDWEPFAAYEEDEQMRYGGRLLSTSSPNWGTSVMTTSSFGYDTHKLYADTYFGAQTTRAFPDGNLAIKAEQAVLRDALDYARRRGLKTCLGFEMSINPLDTANREVFLKRLNWLLDHYPSLDYIWIWQAESQGGFGFKVTSENDPNMALAQYSAARRSTFNRIIERTTGVIENTEEGKAARALEAARLEQIAQLAYLALQHRQNAPRLVISGWGGENRLLSAEYYDGLDKLLPKDVVFSSLDNIVPLPQVDSIYGQLPSDRERWPIPWLEYDGDQWHPQPFVHTYESIVQNARSSGSQGLLGIHWRTRELQENLAYLLQSAWDPTLTAEAFFLDYAKRNYDASVATEMASIHSGLDNLGYRWVGGAGQDECASFTWRPGLSAQVTALQNLKSRAVAVLPNAKTGRTKLEWLIKRMDWVLQYQAAQNAAKSAENYLKYAAAATNPNTKKQYAQMALGFLNQDALGTAMRHYATRVTTRGEYGVLATVNAKAFVAWQNLRNQCIEIIGSGTPGVLGPWNPAPAVLLPGVIASTVSGSTLELNPLILGGSPAWAHYRTLGQSQWSSLSVQMVKDWCGRVTIPASEVVEPGIEIGFSFSSDPGSPMALGPFVISVMPQTTVNTTPLPTLPYSTDHVLQPTIRSTADIPVELTWSPVDQADYYKVMRNGQQVVETAVPLWPDSPIQPTGNYVVQAVRNGAVIGQSAQVAYSVPTTAITETVALQATPLSIGVILEWPVMKSMYVTSYRISRSVPGGQPAVLTQIAASRISGHNYKDVPESPGSYVYYVTPLNAWGTEGQTASVTVTYDPNHTPVPSLVLPLTSAPSGATVIQPVTFGAEGASLTGGYFGLPHQDYMHLGAAMTLTFSFKATSTSGMPVLICHGSYMSDGWYVQILGGRLYVHTPTGDVTGPTITPGTWYNVRLIYDSTRLKLYVGDNLYQSASTTVHDVPVARNLIIGQYETQNPIYLFTGVIRDVTIYNDVVMP